MRTLIWSKASVRTFRRTIKKHPPVRKHIEATLKALEENPFAPRLETHKLKGKLLGSWACSAGYDLRIVFDFVKNEKQKEADIFLLEIGTYEEVY